ncbi:MAG: hypothetical protein QOF30_434 [Acidimicrobiaceae bacterium]|nr:hypothetical protein [Acidimicrobiaceae bacterium]
MGVSHHGDTSTRCGLRAAEILDKGWLHLPRPSDRLQAARPKLEPNRIDLVARLACRGMTAVRPPVGERRRTSATTPTLSLRRSPRPPHCLWFAAVAMHLVRKFRDIHFWTGRRRARSRALPSCRSGGDLTELCPGTVIFTPPGEWHWHGAAQGHFMTHLAPWEAPPKDPRPNGRPRDRPGVPACLRCQPGVGPDDRSCPVVRRGLDRSVGAYDDATDRLVVCRPKTMGTRRPGSRSPSCLGPGLPPTGKRRRPRAGRTARRSACRCWRSPCRRP